MRAFFIITFISLYSFTANATCYPYGTDKYQPSHENNNDILDKPSRIKYANSLLSASQEWSKYLPRLSPAEQKWLQEEIAAGGNRRAKAYISKEKSISSLSNTIDENIEVLNILANGTAKNQQAEIYLWSRLAMNLLDQNYISSIVKLSTKFDILPPKLFGITSSNWYSVNNDQWIYHMCNTNSQNILFYIVLPYLRNN